jgi:hypothetical protein
MTLRLPSGHGPCWDAARTLGEFTYDQLATAADIPYGRVTLLVRTWESLGAVETVGVDADRRTRIRVINPEAFVLAVEAAPPVGKKPTPEGNMWQAMRGLVTFTPRDVASHASTPEQPVTHEDAQAYCRALFRAGYFKVVRKAVSGVREATYRLIRNTGPQAPRERRLTIVYDHNLAAPTYIPEVKP